MKRHPCTSMHATRHQGGVVLVVALVMLVVIGLASVGIMRNVLSNDLVSENNRRQNQAMQAAQAALRFCEEGVAQSVITPAPAAAPNAENWQTFANWTQNGNGAVNPVRVDANFLNSGSVEKYANDDSGAPRPQCMAQLRTVGTGTVTVITARGFSDDYVPRANGETEAGAVVWLQSIIL